MPAIHKGMVQRTDNLLRAGEEGGQFRADIARERFGLDAEGANMLRDVSAAPVNNAVTQAMAALPQNKVGLMERLRDFTHSGALWVRSMDTLEEMRTIAREGDTIEAQGSAKDDRVVALAIGVRNWDQEVRRRLIAGKRTRAAEEMKRRMTVRDQIAMYNQSMLDQFLAGKQRIHRQQVMAARRASWRSG